MLAPVAAYATDSDCDLSRMPGRLDTTCASGISVLPWGWCSRSASCWTILWRR